MHPVNILWRSLRHHWRSHVAVGLCALVGSSVLTGALLVGDSMRGSLRELALRRLGPIDYSLEAPRFIREELAEDVVAEAWGKSPVATGAPAILLDGAIQHADTRARANRIRVLGAGAGFWRLFDGDAPVEVAAVGRQVALNRALAEEIGAKLGDDVLIRLQRPSMVPTETILGRANQSAVSLRLTVQAIIEDDGAGGFGTRPTQAAPKNAFVPLATLQAALEQEQRVNAMLLAGVAEGPEGTDATIYRLQDALAEKATLADYDLGIRIDQKRDYFALETERLLVEPPVEEAAMEAAREIGVRPRPILTYLANTIARVDPNDPTKRTAEIPYSTITALSSATKGSPAVSGLQGETSTAGRSLTSAGETLIGPQEILLGHWAQVELNAHVGDTIEIEYYVSRPLSGLATQTARFTLAAVLPDTDRFVDPGLMPHYRGISGADSVADWDPPPSFKIDLGRIREQDEAYWDLHRGAPKAFVALETGQRLWTAAEGRFGRLTEILVAADDQAEGSWQRHGGLEGASAAFERALLDRLEPEALGLAFEPVRAQALAAGAGTTDFSQLFIAFSFFLIASAAMLVALVFRLGVERRAGEVGLLLATGYAAARVRRRFLLEGAIVADAGAALGILGAVGYAWLILTGLRTWWADAVSAPFLSLHVAWQSFVIGYLASLAIAIASIAWALRGLTRLSPRSLLAGAVQSGGRETGACRVGGLKVTVFASLLVGVGAMATAITTDALPQVPAFFASGAALLVAGLAGLSLRLMTQGRGLLHGGAMAMARLGVRNMTRARGRSLTTAGLIACACFVIVAVGASRRTADADALAKSGGAGGHELMAEAIVPIHDDLNSPAGRDALGLREASRSLLEASEVTALRLKPGDDASCLNLYQKVRPRILGAPEAMIERGGFAFAKSMAETDADRANPWLLLRREFPDGAIPAIGDANTLMWQLKLGLDDDYVITDERGRTRKLRIVAMLSESVFQSELIVAEQSFTEMFPTQSGYRFLLVDAPPESAGQLTTALEEDLEAYGLDVESTVERLNAYRAVENTYMATFQTLGGLGMLLGTLGLAAVMLRNIWERRGELALLRALGYRQSSLGWMVWTETAALLAAGVLIGGTSALVAVGPHVLERPGQLQWLSLGATLAAVVLAGLVSSLAALASALRAPLLPALRAE